MHTKGPWSCRKNPDVNEPGEQWRWSHWIDSPTGIPLAEVRQYDKSEANAHLIAAAPDMLHRLNAVQEDLNTAIDHYDTWSKEKMIQHLMGIQRIVGDDIRKAKG